MSCRIGKYPPAAVRGHGLVSAWRYPLLAGSLLLLLSGCFHQLDIALPAQGPVRLTSKIYNTDTGKTPSVDRLIQPGSAQYQRLGAWLAANQNGWSRVIWTHPSEGIRVTAGRMNLQFNDGDVVVAYAEDGTFYKPIKRQEYLSLTRE